MYKFIEFYDKWYQWNGKDARTQLLEFLNSTDKIKVVQIIDYDILVPMSGTQKALKLYYYEE